jgi:5-(carboxyamino)imidazole ribonucleotide mutase
MGKVVIIMGSKVDFEWAKKIKNALNKFGIESKIRISSAHKTPQKCYEILKEYEKEDCIVFITVAGKSDALSGFIDANTYFPVIACPPYSEKFSGIDIFSTLRMPRGVAPMTILEPENAALAAAKILGLYDKNIREKVKEYQKNIKEEVEKDDKEVQRWEA